MTNRTTPEQTEGPDLGLLARRIRVARAQEAGGRVVNVFTEQVELANVVVADGW